MFERTFTNPDGIRERWTFDADDALVVKRVQDCQPFLDRAHQIREHGNWRGEANDFWHAASIPNELLVKWHQQGLIKDLFFTSDEDWRVVKNLLNGEYKYLKTMPRNL